MIENYDAHHICTHTSKSFKLFTGLLFSFCCDLRSYFTQLILHSLLLSSSHVFLEESTSVRDLTLFRNIALLYIVSQCLFICFNHLTNNLQMEAFYVIVRSKVIWQIVCFQSTLCRTSRNIHLSNNFRLSVDSDHDS